MPRSYGYRAKAAVRKEVEYYRAQLNEVHAYDWQRAGMLMDNITALLGHGGGPSGNRIEPHACKYCKYYGHTKLWCKARIADEDAEIERMLEEDRKLVLRKAPERFCGPPAQAVTFDKLGIPYVIDPDIGPLVGKPGEQHAGKWTFRDGLVVTTKDVTET